MLLLPVKEGDQREGVEATVGVLQEQSSNRGKTMLTTRLVALHHCCISFWKRAGCF